MAEREAVTEPEPARGREQPRGPREGLAEEGAQVVLDEEGALREHGVEESRRGGQHPVAEAAVADGDKVAAAVRVVADGSVAELELPDRRPVGGRAWAAPLLERFVPPELDEQVRGWFMLVVAVVVVAGELVSTPA